MVILQRIFPQGSTKFFFACCLSALLFLPFSFPLSAQELIQQGGISGVVPQIQKTGADVSPPNLQTPWGKELTGENVHQEYPRPMMVREQWLNLNGLWSVSGTNQTAEQETAPSGNVLVPFPLESSLSAYHAKSYSPSFEYRREFTIPADWAKDSRILLHFGAVDWETTVWVNGKEAGRHRGGYDPFSFDITEALVPGAVNQLSVQVFDPVNEGIQPRGKQSRNPSGIWYSPVSGIWQTVWLEPVPQDYIRSVQIFPDSDSGYLTVYPFVQNPRKKLTLVAEIFDDGKPLTVAYGGSGGPLLLKLPEETLKRWSPDAPNLYQLRVQLLENEKPIDQVDCYCAFRKIEIRKETPNGIPRIYLNNEPFFLMGVTDQGYFPDGLYTAPSDAALRMDIRVAKTLGFNTIRKFWKIEPQRWYFWCDRLGILVWQDIPGGENRSLEAQHEFKEEMQRMILPLMNHPSVVLWSLFNEGMGQHNTAEYVALVRKIDPSRLVNGASGWVDTGDGDLSDRHQFPGPEMPPRDPLRASVIGSFGGFTLVPPAENLWSQSTWGFQHVPDSDTLLRRYRTMHLQLRKMIREEGLSGAVFHQLTDVESECNGLTSYDRVLLKIPPEEFFKINKETIDACQ